MLAKNNAEYIENLSMDGSKEASLYDKTRFGMVKTAIMKTLCQDHKAVVMCPDRFTVPEVTEDDAHEGLLDSIRDGSKAVASDRSGMRSSGNKTSRDAEGRPKGGTQQVLETFQGLGLNDEHPDQDWEKFGNISGAWP